jgi:hypothetical protein
MDGSEDIFGGAAVLLGIILFLWRNKRRFDRTNAAGIEQFSSYGGKVVARFWDVIIWVFAFSSLTLGILVLAHEHVSTWGWIVLLPIYIWLLLGFPLGRSK